MIRSNSSVASFSKLPSGICSYHLHKPLPHRFLRVCIEQTMSFVFSRHTYDRDPSRRQTLNGLASLCGEVSETTQGEKQEILTEFDAFSPVRAWVAKHRED